MRYPIMTIYGDNDIEITATVEHNTKDFFSGQTVNGIVFYIEQWNNSADNFACMSILLSDNKLTVLKNTLFDSNDIRFFLTTLDQRKTDIREYISEEERKRMKVKTITNMAPSYRTQPFIPEYVEPLMKLIRLVFIKFNEENPFDIYALIDAYMTDNEARLGMDKGNPKYLNMGWKQVYNRTPMENLQAGSKLDDIALHWMADVYTYWQWAYNLPSPEISRRCNAQKLMKEYITLHQTGLTATCRKLTEKYFPEVYRDDD